ncbi:MAG TPA: hypothetical protein VJM08_08225 [Anaerolineales bacterium]|nr:hypothetical protein [Anaerolineales bacterium]
MKKIAIVVLAAHLLGACLPLTPAPAPNVPTVDVAGTAQAGAQTSVAQTLTAFPTITVAPATDTATPPIAVPTDTATTVPSTPTPVPSLTTTPATATSAPTNPAFTSTATLASAPGAATLTAIPTLTIRTYGTLPPAVPFTTVILVNKAKTEAYISLQTDTLQGGPTIIEYPVEGTVKILAPIGDYLYVAWVGGRKMVGNFSLRKVNELTITLFRDKVVINK